MRKFVVCVSAEFEADVTVEADGFWLDDDIGVLKFNRDRKVFLTFNKGGWLYFREVT